MEFINEQGNNYGEGHRRPHGRPVTSVVVSGDSDQNDDDSDSSEAEYSGDGNASALEEKEDFTGMSRHEQDLLRFDPSNPAHVDELYDQNLDEEDEAYVYRHMRGGIVETVTVRTNTAESSDPNHTCSESMTTQQRKVLKPRYSDAVLSCPCCFNIVCMDCQRHQRYPNQFRAMFVMGIAVDWQSKLIYDEARQILVPKPPPPPNEVPTDPMPKLYDSGEKTNTGSSLNHYVEGEYFPVLCQNCGTQVASLDMVEEIYHFHGCLESS